MITANIPFSERNKSAASINLQRHGVNGLRSLLVIRFVIFGIKWVGTIKYSSSVLLQIHLSQHENKIADHSMEIFEIICCLFIGASSISRASICLLASLRKH
jgi:hypothetical protein